MSSRLLTVFSSLLPRLPMLPGIEPVGAVHLHIATCLIITCHVSGVMCHVSRVACRTWAASCSWARAPPPWAPARPPSPGWWTCSWCEWWQWSGVFIESSISDYIATTQIESFMQTVTVYRIFWPKKFIPIETELWVKLEAKFVVTLHLFEQLAWSMDK